MREDLKKRKQQMKKSDGPLVEIVGLTPELVKMASEELYSPPKIIEKKKSVVVDEKPLYKPLKLEDVK